MFAYTCPKCQQRLGSEIIQNGVIVQCVKCQQRMRVVLSDKPANSRAAIKQPRGRIAGPLLLGASALVGIAIGGVIFFNSSSLEGKPAQNVESKDAIAQTNVQDSPKPEAKPKAEAKPKPDTTPKPDVGPKPDAGAMTSDELYNEMLKSSVWILASDGNESWSGSGSLIDRDERLVITNQHVANRRCKSILVVFPLYRDGKLVTERESYLSSIQKKPENVFSAELVYDRAICDLALIRLSGLPKGVKALQLSKRKIRPGQALHTVGGNPKGNAGVWIYSSGNVRQISTNKWKYEDGLPREGEIIASSVSTNSGDSGGAVVDSRGFLVGVHAMASAGVLNAGHIHINEVRSFLQAAYRQQLDKQFMEAPDEGEATVSTDKVLKLIKGLEAPESENRKRAAIALGKIGPDAQRAAISLLRIVQNTTEVDAVRRAAIAALHEIGAPDYEHLKVLLSALEDKKCTEARRYAAESLASFPEDKRKETIEALKNALKDEDSKVKQKAATALGSYGKAAQEDASAELVDCLRDGDSGVRIAAYNALKAGGIPDQFDKATVKELLIGQEDKKATPEARYWGILLVVRGLKEEGLPYLLEALAMEENYKDPAFVKYVVQELRDFKLDNLQVGTILSKALDHRDESVQAETIQTLATLDFGENTVEAYIKLFVKGPKLLAKLEKQREQKNGENGQKKYDIVADTKRSFTTFAGGSGLGFKVTPKLLDVLIKAVGETNDLARRVALNCLERIGKEAAEAAPALRAALLQEKAEEIRIEILAALAALGKAGGDKLGDDKELQEELDKWIGEARADNHTVRVMAALAMASLYPDQKQSSKAYRILARALLLTNADIKIDLIQRTRIGVTTVPVSRPAPDKVQLELHERAKQALSRGGVVAGEAICTVFDSNFWSSGSEKVNLIYDKVHARLTAFQVLGKIGPPLMVLKKVEKGRPANPVRLLIDKEIKLDKVGLEDSRVVDAAREAQVEIFRK